MRGGINTYRSGAHFKYYADTPIVGQITMSGFLRQHGATLIAAAVGLILVLLGLLFKQAELVQTGIFSLGGSAGIHVGGNTNAVPVKLDDAIETMELAGVVFEDHKP